MGVFVATQYGTRHPPSRQAAAKDSQGCPLQLPDCVPGGLVPHLPGASAMSRCLLGAVELVRCLRMRMSAIGGPFSCLAQGKGSWRERRCPVITDQQRPLRPASCGCIVPCSHCSRRNRVNKANWCDGRIECTFSHYAHHAHHIENGQSRDGWHVRSLVAAT